MEEVLETIKTQNGDDTGLVVKEEVRQLRQPTQEEYLERQKRLEEIEKIDPGGKPVITSKYWEATVGDSIKGEFTGWEAN